MSERLENQYIPETVSPPGETLQEVLEMHGMSQSELASRTGRPTKTINEIIRGKAAITPETALQLELVLGVPASFWNSRERHYREAIARRNESRSLAAQVQWLRQMPYRAMVRLGWVPDRKNKIEQVQDLLKFFGVASPASWAEIWGVTDASFRQSAAFRCDPGAVAAWLRKGEIEARDLAASEFDATRFTESLSRIRRLTRDLPQDFDSVLVRECAGAGVSVVFVPELPGTCAWGATRWLSQSNALVQLSLRYKTDDHLWFTFFHEAGHILRHGKRDRFIESDAGPRSQKESEADAFARDFLIPDAEYKRFRRLGAMSCAAISRFAHQLGIAPGIVVGRLQHDGALNMAHCNSLKKRLTWRPPSEQG